MKTIQEKIQKFSHVIYVFAKIGYVASIVGLCLCGATIIWCLATGDPYGSIQLGNVTLKGLLVEGNMNIADLCGNMAYVIVYCAFFICIMRLIMRLFSNMSSNYTPFTMENAQILKKTAIYMIIASIVPATVGQAVGSTMAKLYTLTFEGNYADGFSIVVVLLFFAMSMVFTYGCALQEQADSTL